MASAYRKRKTWYASYRDAAGGFKSVATTAQTKTDARRIAHELETKAERQRHGLEPMTVDCKLTLTELCQWWLKSRCPEPSLSKERSRLTRHVFSQPLGKLLVPQVTTARMEDRFREMELAKAMPASLNKLRATLHSVFVQARKAELWLGPNPAAAVEPRRVSKRAYATLRAEEVPGLLQAVPESWRGLFACALFTGMRKGELYGLQKSDVDLDARTMLVTRSHQRDTTKGGHADTIPIAEPLLPYLANAIAASNSELVFPRADGSMRPIHSVPQKVLRTALARAGLVDGFDHTCRRCKSKGTPHVERHPDDAERRCPNCGMALWPSSIVRPMRFHDLRHTTATLLLRAGVAAHLVQRILRHSDLRTTLGTYSHLDVDDLREAMTNLPAVDAPSSAPAMEAEASTGTDPAAKVLPFSTRLLPAHGAANEEAGPSAQIAPDPAYEPHILERNTGFEPATFALARRRSTS